MQKNTIAMLLASSILLAGIFVAGCTDSSSSVAATDTLSTIPTQSHAADRAPAGNSSQQPQFNQSAGPSGTMPDDMMTNGTRPSGTPPDGMMMNGTRPQGGPDGMEMNGTLPEGIQPGEGGNGPSGTPPSGTPPSGTPSSG